MLLRASNDAGLSQQLAEVQEDVKRLTLKWDKFISAPVFDRRSPSPSGRKVTFVQPEARIRSWPQRTQTPNFANGDNRDNRAPRRTFGQRQRFNANAQQQRWDYRSMMTCQKCEDKCTHCLTYVPRSKSPATSVSDEGTSAVVANLPFEVKDKSDTNDLQTPTTEVERIFVTQ